MIKKKQQPESCFFDQSQTTHYVEIFANAANPDLALQCVWKKSDKLS